MPEGWTFSSILRSDASTASVSSHPRGGSATSAEMIVPGGSDFLVSQLQSVTTSGTTAWRRYSVEVVPG